ncbi:peptidase C45 acyl-coenzyme A--6- aminopenicillanic acid acyl-transferase [Halomonas sp. MCCC 1A17488]|uniref:Peptidase C45 acyl-coenzyme A--6-aminopenicillanic acid acyl-transferase n=1 Tax=Billgrantia sulfidoxydans TaxID=2733484 RepID=A0ABX7VZ08_9GAMM|nr:MULTISPECIES: C45 family peptidase [Halomonas]MCE8016914.1 peptidase C45 acyl-coenzyme A--6- aminopenicillanic acid acyl-transferase [Halomonas sp. MCCC 1A17488]MCG3240247.1 peptidase C45 acyl-coenzyme A--6- aminopenicillanic acid acyl-transferase [Halomonas sp. MCCC 1A17488]QPP49876.1 peptidase C45 acyl-coenzyme A--6- aminopenicillanic acid acyl-transferase [Halomonas sp. SS10-MC5]QTP53491.1 peptidase C45 acyl-coenzyme A--6- aminopenicillanic acid acyl-transferase [Halomonas sulfidoxydans]
MSRQTRPLAITELTGSHHEIGAEHGRIHRHLIERSLQVYAQLFHDFVGLRWAEARDRACHFEAQIAQGFPEILEEMNGIAWGADVDFIDILTLNCRSEIALTQADGGCSAFSLLRHGQQWLAQNWDWRHDQLDNVVALHIQGDGRPALVSIGEAGMVGKVGLNARGIGVCLNAIRSQTCGAGLPIHIALRKILESEDMPSALAVATHQRVCSPAHFLLADGDGQAVGLEVQPGEPGRILPRGGIVTHTNHLYADNTPCPVRDFPRVDSWPRLCRLDALLHDELAADADLDEASLFDILSDHQGAPLSICRHFNPDQPAEERMETLFSVVMNLSERRLTVRHGKPCESADSLSIALG